MKQKFADFCYYLKTHTSRRLQFTIYRFFMIIGYIIGFFIGTGLLISFFWIPENIMHINPFFGFIPVAITSFLAMAYIRSSDDVDREDRINEDLEEELRKSYE